MTVVKCTINLGFKGCVPNNRVSPDLELAYNKLVLCKNSDDDEGLSVLRVSTITHFQCIFQDWVYLAVVIQIQ